MHNVTIDDIREKYKDRDIIEIQYPDFEKMDKWIKDQMGPDPDDDDAVKTVYKYLTDKDGNFFGFVKKGVIIITREDGFSTYFPFEFKDDSIQMTVVVYSYDGPKPCIKISVNKNLEINVIERDTEFINWYYNEVRSEPTKRTVMKKYPDMESYYLSLIKSTIYYVIGPNIYLSGYDKEVLYSKIQQRRPLRAGTKKKSAKKTPLYYRYVVDIPENYVPRKFDHANYIASEWTRAAHLTHVWVNRENAEIIARKLNGEVIATLVKAGKVRVRYPKKPATVHRRINNEGEIIKKVYK